MYLTVTKELPGKIAKHQLCCFALLYHEVIPLAFLEFALTKPGVYLAAGV